MVVGGRAAVLSPLVLGCGEVFTEPGVAGVAAEGPRESASIGTLEQAAPLEVGLPHA